LNRLRPGDQPDPRIRRGRNSIDFTNNPFGGVGAITLGNTTTYSGDPYDPRDQAWADYYRRTKQDIRGHELQHTIQGEQLGPAYLLSHLISGLLGLAVDRDERGAPDWHGRHNWNERGPGQIPPRPW
jgi:hypothetical protein